MSQQHTSLLSPELYALGVPPMLAGWVLLLWWADYCGWSHRHGSPLVWLVVRPCIAWRLPAAGWQGQVMRSWLRDPGGGSQASAFSLVGRTLF